MQQTNAGDKVYFILSSSRGEEQLDLFLDRAKWISRQEFVWGRRRAGQIVAHGTIARAALDLLVERQRQGNAKPTQRLPTGHMVPTTMVVKAYLQLQAGPQAEEAAESPHEVEQAVATEVPLRGPLADLIERKFDGSYVKLANLMVIAAADRRKFAGSTGGYDLYRIVQEAIRAALDRENEHRAG